MLSRVQQSISLLWLREWRLLISLTPQLHNLHHQPLVSLVQPVMRCVCMPVPPTASVQTGTTNQLSRYQSLQKTVRKTRLQQSIPAVNLTALADRVEAAHFPDSMATRPRPQKKKKPEKKGLALRLSKVSAADSSVVEQCYTSEVYFGKRSLKNEVIYSSSFIVTLTDSPLHSVD